MQIQEITTLDHPGLEVFSQLTEAQLRNRLEPDKGLFIAESPKVIRVALDAGYEPQALLCERKHITGDAVDIMATHWGCTCVYGRPSAVVTTYGICFDAWCSLRHETPPAEKRRRRVP